MSTRNLAAKRDKLKKSAKAATTLAHSERLIADEQHALAGQLEVLASGLDEQVSAIEAEMAASTMPVAKAG